MFGLESRSLMPLVGLAALTAFAFLYLYNPSEIMAQAYSEAHEAANDNATAAEREIAEGDPEYGKCERGGGYHSPDTKWYGPSFVKRCIKCDEIIQNLVM